MDKQLKEAASTGDVTILDRFSMGELTISDAQFLSFDDWEKYNIIHLALHYRHEEFVRTVFSVLEQDVLVKLVFHTNIYGSNSLHAAAFYGCLKTAELLIEFYRTLPQNEGNNGYAEAPWLVANKVERTPLHDALVEGYDEVACYLFSLEPASLYDKLDNKGRSPLFLAVRSGCDKFVDKILGPDIPATDASFSGSDGKSALHQAIIEKRGGNILRKLLEKLNDKREIMWKKDSKGWTALHYAAEIGEDWLVTLLLEKAPASNFFMFDEDVESPLRIAWESRRYLPAARIFKHFPMMIKCRSENNTTLLHHIKLQSQQEYEGILQIPEIQLVLNVKDNNGMTPLHQAITEDNIVLAELLFKMEAVNKDIKNKEGKTPICLLKEKALESSEFAELSQKPGIIPRGSFLAYGIDLKEVRSSVIVVAALLATITFQAAFTFPDQIKTRTVVFAIFFLSNTFAMCTSLIVLNWLIWAMVEDDIKKSRKLADRSFFLLQFSFYGTLGAFAIAAVAISNEKSSLLAIGVTVLCLCVPVLSNNKFICEVFKKKGRRKSHRS